MKNLLYIFILLPLFVIGQTVEDFSATYNGEICLADNNMSVILTEDVLSDFYGGLVQAYYNGNPISESSEFNNPNGVGVVPMGNTSGWCYNNASPGVQIEFAILMNSETVVNIQIEPPLTYIADAVYFVDNSSYYLSFAIDGATVVLGCTDDVYLEFDSSANLNDGSCATLIVEGCTNTDACNYNDFANVDDGSCIYAEQYYDCDDVCLEDADLDGVCDELEIPGCQDPIYLEYNPSATEDDFSCNTLIVYGCTYSFALNFNSLANVNDGSCQVEGCTEDWADNYDYIATENDGSCYNYGCTEDWADNYDDISTENDGSCYKYGCTDDWADNYDDISTENDGFCYKMGCTEDWADNYDDIATGNDGSCYKYGCTENWADNYDELATDNNGSCSLESCTSTWADNYDSNATIDDGSCYKVGCTNVLALNYDELVTVDDGTCEYEIITQLTLSNDAWNISINLDEGWNMFGYGCPNPIDVVEGLSNHTDKISLVKDNDGSVYIPEFSFDGIGNLTPGFGYQIKLTEEIEGFSLCESYINDVSTNDLESILEELSSNSDSLLQMNNTIVSLQEENVLIHNEVDSLQADLDSIILSYTDWMPIVNGCTDLNAFNYNSAANTDDGDCTPVVVGCIDETAFNFNANLNANTDDGSCVEVVEGCIDTLAFNYNSFANTAVDCIAVEEGCTDDSAFNYNSDANMDDGSCYPFIGGCLIDTALNYLTQTGNVQIDANIDDGSCIYNHCYYPADSGFVSFLEINFDNLISGDCLDTIAALDITEFVWEGSENYNTVSLDGLQFFKNLSLLVIVDGFYALEEIADLSNLDSLTTILLDIHHLCVEFPELSLDANYEVIELAGCWTFNSENFSYNIEVFTLHAYSNQTLPDLSGLTGLIDLQIEDNGYSICAIGYPDQLTIEENWPPICQYGCMDSLACNYNPEANMADGSCSYPEQGYDCEGSFTAEIGDIIEGGYLFYLDETGEHGLVAALEDLTEGSNMGNWGSPEGFEWGCYGTSGATAYQNYAIGTGLDNTEAIVSQNCQTENGGITAAQATLNYETEGYTDWFLPSRHELEEMYNTIGNGGSEGNIGGFETSDYHYYWSSSETSSSDAWGVGVNNGSTTSYYKNYSLRVRAVRSF